MKEKAVKVKNKLIIALALAVPISLVSADELVINDYAPVSGDVDTSLKLQETVNITPMDFKDVTVVPPDLDEAIGVSAAPGARPRILPDAEEIAYRESLGVY